jgi:TetR/AcrR family transcriptional regulator
LVQNAPIELASWWPRTRCSGPTCVKARQERSRQSRARILEVAITIFAQRGYTGASTREIADAAEVNQGLVTYYFGSKQALWRAAVDQAASKYRNAFADRMAELNDPEDRGFYRFALRHYVQWASENANVLRILLSNDQAEREAAQWYSERHNRPFYDVWTMLIREGQSHGIIRPGPVLNLYYFLVSTATVFATAQDVKLMSGEDVSDPAFIEAHAELLYDMLIVPEGG